MFDSLDARLAAEFEPLGLRHLHNIASPVVVWRWRVPGPSDAADSHVATLPFNGQQFLDPKVARLLVELHMCSARLALSDAVDAILMGPDAGQNSTLAKALFEGFMNEEMVPRTMSYVKCPFVEV